VASLGFFQEGIGVGELDTSSRPTTTVLCKKVASVCMVRFYFEKFWRMRAIQQHSFGRQIMNCGLQYSLQAACCRHEPGVAAAVRSLRMPSAAPPSGQTLSARNSG
jgi:hypothetical protein